MREPVWSGEKPDVEDIDVMWRELSVERVGIDAPAMTTMVTGLRAEYSNGGVELACFRVGEHTVFDWFASRNRLAEVGFPDRFLHHPTVVAAFPEIRLGEELTPPRHRASKRGWTSLLAFDLVGRWAHHLYIGGVYTQLPEYADDRNKHARAMLADATRAFQELFEERYADLLVFRTPDILSNWFAGLLDTTYVVLDRATREVWVLALTDVD